MAYLSLKLGDVYAESKGVMDNNITKNIQNFQSYLQEKPLTIIMALIFFPKTILLLKVDYSEGILNQIEIDGMVNDYSSSCNLQQFKKIYANIIKKPLAIFSHAYQHNH